MPGSELQAGKVFVDLVPRLEQGFGRSVEKELDGPLSRIRGKAEGIGKLLAVGIGAGVAGGGALLYGAASQLDSFYDSIEIGTGKAGSDLDALKESARNVARTVPNSLEEVGSAIALISSRTDLTGAPLEAMTEQLLTLSRITGSDLKTTVEESTRFFGDWGIAVADQGPALDSLFALSQKTGVGISDLQARLVKYGAPLRQLGFDYETSASMIAKFEKEGVNTDLVLGSMRVALGKMARAGEAPAETFARVTDEIKNAGSAGEANALALELFGARAGPDMAAAIREGRFEVDDFATALGDTTDKIGKTADSTDDFGEKFATLRNRAILAAEPLAGKLFDALNGIADEAGPVVDWIGDRLPGAFDAVREAVAPMVDAAKEVFSILFEGDFTGDGPWSEDSEIVDGLFRLRDLFLDELLPAGRKIFDFVSRNLKPILFGLGAAFLFLTAPITATIATLIGLYVRFEWFRDFVDAVVKWLVDNVPPAWEAMRAAAATAWDWIEANVVPKIQQIAEWIQIQIAGIVEWIRDHWDQISAVFSSAVDFVASVVRAGLGLLEWLWNTFGEELIEIVRILWDYISSTISAGFDVIAGIFDFFSALFHGKWGDAWDALLQILEGVWDAFYATIEAGGRLIGQALEIVLSALREIWDGAFEGMKAVLGGLWDGLTDAAKAALNGMLAALELGINFAIDLLNTALDGIDKAAGPLVNFGEIPSVEIPRLARGGNARNPGLAIVGDGGNGSGAELLAMPRGAAVVPLKVGKMIAEAALVGAGTRAGGLTIETNVDARGIDDPAAVGDYTSRHIAWRLNSDGVR